MGQRRLARVSGQLGGHKLAAVRTADSVVAILGDVRLDQGQFIDLSATWHANGGKIGCKSSLTGAALL